MKSIKYIINNKKNKMGKRTRSISYGMKPKKSLGQNFLKSIPALNKIVEAGEISTEDIILEIGPGKGALTEKLLEKFYPPNSSGGLGCVIAVEKDYELFDFLQKKFAKEIEEKKLILLNEDILNFSPSFEKYKVIANIPYNITGAIFKKFLTEKNQPKLMVLMVQKEIAERIMAHDGKESILSISIKAYGDPKMIMKVPARYFSPSPKVDSAIISIKNISREVFTKNAINPVRGREGSQRASTSNGINERVFWEIVRTGFAHKRKKLSSNLKNFLPLLPRQDLGNKRAEELTLKDWIDITKML